MQIFNVKKFRKGGIFITTEYLLNQEVERVLALLTPENRLAVRVSLHTGLRINDVLQLKTAQLKPRFWITEAKTGKRKLVGLPASLLQDLQREAGEIYVFPSRCDPGRPRSRQAVWADVKRASKALRLPQNVAPHSFRKAYAVELYEKYGTIKKVQRALNHRNPETTQIYALADLFLMQKNKKKRGRA